MNKDEIIDLTEKISNLAYDILIQLNEHKIKPTYIDEFYLGILMRIRSFTRDIMLLLKSNHENQITSVFVLLRVMIDDFIRLFSVYARPKTMKEEIIKIEADAHDHRFKSINESASINNQFFNGNKEGYSTQEFYDEAVNKFKENPKNDKFFSNKETFKFKKLPPISNTFKIMQNDIKVNANIHSFAIYKFLTQYVHFSNLTLDIQRTPSVRELEINQIEEILLYSYKALLMIYDYFNKTYPIKLKDELIKTHYNDKMSFV